MAAEQILRELAACRATDPYRTKSWMPQMRGKWITVNVPGELWERIQRMAQSTDGVALPSNRSAQSSNPGLQGKGDVAATPNDQGEKA